MLATVSQTRSLVGTYYYDRALNKQEKGGHVIASNGIPQYSSAKTQLNYMLAYCSDKYKVKAGKFYALPPMTVGTKIPNDWGIYDMLGKRTTR